MKLKERYRLGPKDDGTSASSDDELEQETSFTTSGDFNATKGFSNPIQVSSGEEDFDDLADIKERWSSKTKAFR